MLCLTKSTSFFLVQTENSGDLDSDFNWEDFRDRSNAKQAGVIIGLIFGLIWPYIAWIFLKLAGYAVIGMTFGHGHEFVSSTFFRWTEKMGNGFYKMILQQGGVCWCQLFYIASMALGCFLGYTFTELYVENYARFLQESNLTLAETQVKFQEIGDIDFILLIVVLVLFGIFGVVLLAFSCGLFSEGIADYYILLFGQMTEILYSCDVYSS